MSNNRWFGPRCDACSRPLDPTKTAVVTFTIDYLGERKAVQVCGKCNGDLGANRRDGEQPNIYQVWNIFRLLQAGYRRSDSRGKVEVNEATLVVVTKSTTAGWAGYAIAEMDLVPFGPTRSFPKVVQVWRDGSNCLKVTVIREGVDE